MENEIVKVESAPLVAQQSAEELQVLCESNQAKRTVILNYIRANFAENIDYGPSDPRSNKKTLLKPGAEKICRLFNTRPIWTKDTDTWEMLGNPAGTVCYKCEIIDNVTGRVIAEGRGAEKVGNKQRDANKAIKNAEKCAMVDAALNAFQLSELFTQDLEQQAKITSLDDEEDTPASKEDKLVLWRLVKAHIASKKVSQPLAAEKLIVAVVTDLFQKAQIDTMKEKEAVYQAIISGQYDLETGNRIPPVKENE
jgi:hypothetical protein